MTGLNFSLEYYLKTGPFDTFRTHEIEKWPENITRDRNNTYLSQIQNNLNSQVTNGVLNAMFPFWAKIESLEQGTLRPGHFFFSFKMRTPRGSPSRETIRSPSIVCWYIRAYIPTCTIEHEPIFTLSLNQSDYANLIMPIPYKLMQLQQWLILTIFQLLFSKIAKTFHDPNRAWGIEILDWVLLPRQELPNQEDAYLQKIIQQYLAYAFQFFSKVFPFWNQEDLCQPRKEKFHKLVFQHFCLLLQQQ